MAGSNATFLARRLARFARDENGATAIEYALIAIGISVAIAGTVYSLSDVVLTDYYERLANEMAAASR